MNCIPTFVNYLFCNCISIITTQKLFLFFFSYLCNTSIVLSSTKRRNCCWLIHCDIFISFLHAWLVRWLSTCTRGCCWDFFCFVIQFGLDEWVSWWQFLVIQNICSSIDSNLKKLNLILLFFLVVSNKYFYLSLRSWVMKRGEVKSKEENNSGQANIKSSP